MLAEARLPRSTLLLMVLLLLLLLMPLLRVVAHARAAALHSQPVARQATPWPAAPKPPLPPLPAGGPLLDGARQIADAAVPAVAAVAEASGVDQTRGQQAALLLLRPSAAASPPPLSIGPNSPPSSGEKDYLAGSRKQLSSSATA